MIETAVIVAAIVGVVEVIKRAFKLPRRFTPLLALMLGIGTMGYLDGFTSVNVFAGVLAGLTASGLYSGVKTTIQK